MGTIFYPMFANWARAKNDVGSRFWTWKLFAKIARMTKMIKKAKMAKIAEIAKIVEIAKIARIDGIAKIAKIAETEIVIFLKTFKIWVFF